MAMKLTGIIEDVFNGRSIFRGYATLKHLAVASRPGEYQREADVRRLPEMKAFMESSRFSFFPELIFGLQLTDPSALKKLKYEQDRGTILLNDGIKFVKAKFTFETIIGENPKTKVMSIDIPDEIISQKPLTRLDGNHRLNVIDDLLKDNSDSELLDVVVPFSILMQIKGDEAQRYESAFFYLINSKAEALTSEENLSAIFNNKSFSTALKAELLNMSDEQIECIESVASFLEQSDLEIYGKAHFSFALKLIRFTQNYSYKQLQKAIIYLSGEYEELKIGVNSIEIILVLLKYLVDNNKVDYRRFAKWVKSNDIVKVDGLYHTKLIEIYEHIHRRREYNVFVAMPYISFKRVTDFNKLFNEVIEEISEKKVAAKVKLTPIMRFRGNSQRIDSRLIKCIKDCDIFIADLTTCNNNVIFEIGLAEGNNKPKLLIKAESDNNKMPFDEAELKLKEQVPFDMDKLQWIPYSSSGYYNDIKNIIRNNLPIILKENYDVPIIEDYK